jgi:2,5-diketo-D-gluconate reductase B
MAALSALAQAILAKSGIPPVGLGTSGRVGPEGRDAILTAIEIGYRHIDSAQSYGSEAPVGEAMRQSGLSRGEFFITTKVADSRLDRAQFLPSVERSLETIGTGYVDLLLVHWPSQHDAVPFEDYMTSLGEAKARGWARRIGVSNFPIADLMRTDGVLGLGALATDQVELHPFLQSPKLHRYARGAKLTLTAYRPLAHGRVGENPELQSLARQRGVSPATLALAFLIAEGHAVVPASRDPGRLRENLAALELELTADEIARIRRLDRGERLINPGKSPKWDD